MQFGHEEIEHEYTIVGRLRARLGALARLVTTHAHETNLMERVAMEAVAVLVITQIFSLCQGMRAQILWPSSTAPETSWPWRLDHFRSVFRRRPSARAGSRPGEAKPLHHNEKRGMNGNAKMWVMTRIASP